LKEFLGEYILPSKSGLTYAYFVDPQELGNKVRGDLKNMLISLARRKDKISGLSREELTQLRDTLQEAFIEHGTFLAKYSSSDGNDIEYQLIINKAIGVCNSANDRDESWRECLNVYADSPDFDTCYKKYGRRLAYIAKMRLTPYFVKKPVQDSQREAEVDKMGAYRTRNRDAMLDALSRFAELIANS
jgi:hypothetical protein